jgi:hypothetical protein
MAGQIVTLSEVKAYLQIPNPSQPASTDVIMQGYIDAATEYVENYVGPVTETDYVERHDGYTSEIVLLHRPILRINSLVEVVALVVDNLEESVTRNPIDGYQVNYRSGKIKRVFSGGYPRIFWPGSRNIEVSYTAGYEPVPAQVRLATLELVTHYWRNGQEAGPTGVGAGIDAFDAVDQQPGMWPAIPYRVAAWLDNYRTPSIG